MWLNLSTFGNGLDDLDGGGGSLRTTREGREEDQVDYLRTASERGGGGPRAGEHARALPIVCTEVYVPYFRNSMSLASFRTSSTHNGIAKRLVILVFKAALSDATKLPNS